MEQGDLGIYVALQIFVNWDKSRCSAFEFCVRLHEMKCNVAFFFLLFDDYLMKASLSALELLRIK